VDEQPLRQHLGELLVLARAVPADESSANCVPAHGRISVIATGACTRCRPHALEVDDEVAACAGAHLRDGADRDETAGRA
jgi:hypothetical protein